MKPLSWLCLVAAVTPVLSSVLKPIRAYDITYVDVPQKRHIDIEKFAYVKGRAHKLGEVSLAKKLPLDNVLFNVALGKSKGDASASLSMTVVCISCYTTGTAVVTTDGVQKDESIFDTIGGFFKDPDPREIVANALDLNLEVNIENLGGHFEFGITFAAAGTYTVTLFRSQTPVGIALNDDDKIGFFFTLELIFTVSGAVDLTTGFDIVFPKGASFTLNPLNGEIVGMNIDGAQVKSIPVKFKKGAACIAAILRLKFQVGVGLQVLGKGFDFEAGVFFDPIQYKACITYDPKKTCSLEFTENFYEEIGAYARAVVDLDFAKLSAGPTAVSTFFTGALPSTCISSSQAKKTTKTLPKTSPPALKETKASDSGKTAGSDSGKTVISTKVAKQTSTPTAAKDTAASSPTAPGGAFYTSDRSGDAKSSHSHKGFHTSIKGTGSHKTRSHKTGSHHKPTSVAHGPYGNSTSGASGPALTTSVITTTSVYTITSCKPEVTDCPAKIGKVTSEVIVTTTVCPVSDAEPTSTSIADGAVGSNYTIPFPTGNKASNSTGDTPGGSDLVTKTIYSTDIYTITSCRSQYIYCPATLASAIVQTNLVVQYTTVCPASQTEFPSTLPTPIAPAPTGPGAVKGVAPPVYTPEPVVKTIVIVDPVTLTACPTPIVKTFDDYVPVPTYAANITSVVPHPSADSTPVVVEPSTQVSPPDVKPTEEAPAPSATEIPEAPPATQIPEAPPATPTGIKVDEDVRTNITASPTPEPPIIQANGASSGSDTMLMKLIAVTFVGVVAAVMY